MNRVTITGVALVAILSAASTADAQVTEKTIRAQFAEFEGAVIRIKTVADLKYREHGPTDGDGFALQPYSVDGTGVVIGETWVDGQREYLVLTNHHVADASNYVLEEDGYLYVNPSNTLAVPRVREESYLLQTSAEDGNNNGIELVELVRLVRGDMTLMRTVHADRELPVFDGPIGYVEGQIAIGDPIVASGFPFGQAKIVSTGTILETAFPHDLGLAHNDLVISMPVQPGQSGGPVFRVEKSSDGDQLTFRLIGLVHAKDITRSFAVSYDLWDTALDRFPEELQVRMVR